MTQINFKRTPVAEAARIMRERHKAGAETIVWDRVANAKTQACGKFWRNVSTEIEGQRIAERSAQPCSRCQARGYDRCEPLTGILCSSCGLAPW